MDVLRNDPPRVFEAAPNIHLKDCGRVQLEPEEQVTFVTPAGGEYDVARKPWGFYATPSVNGRLPQFGLRAALTKGRRERWYILLCETGREPEFTAYLDREGMRLVCWLDDARNLESIEQLFRGGRT